MRLVTKSFLSLICAGFVFSYGNDEVITNLFFDEFDTEDTRTYKLPKRTQKSTKEEVKKEVKDKISVDTQTTKTINTPKTIDNKVQDIENLTIKKEDIQKNVQTSTKQLQNAEQKSQKITLPSQTDIKNTQQITKNTQSTNNNKNLSNSGYVNLSELQAQIDMLQEQVQELRKQNQQIDAVNLQKQIDELYDKTDENELQATLSKVKMGLEFTSAIYNVYNKPQNNAYNQSNGLTKSQHLNKGATEVHLNLNANINDRTKFTGRLSMAKYWGNIGNKAIVADFEAGKNMQGNSAIYLDRAYIDYSIIPGTLIATIGRLPGTDGPGSNLRNNSVRMSTYPALLFNAMGDAAVITYRPELLQDFRTALRLGFVRFYQGSYMDVSNSRDLLYPTGSANSNLYYASVESELPLGYFGKNLAIFSYVHGDNITVPVHKVQNGWTLLDDSFGFGNLDTFNFHFENYNTFGTDFSWFLSASALVTSRPRDNSAQLEAAVRNNLALTGAIAQITANAGETTLTQETINFINNVVSQVVNSDELKLRSRPSWALHLGARYDFTQALKLGAEYFHGSKYWYALSRTGINDPLDFRNVRGNVYDIYGIWQLDFNQYLRFGYTNIHYQYVSGNMMGLPIRTKDKSDIFSLTYNIRF